MIRIFCCDRRGQVGLEIYLVCAQNQADIYAYQQRGGKGLRGSLAPRTVRVLSARQERTNECAARNDRCLYRPKLSKAVPDGRWSKQSPKISESAPRTTPVSISVIYGEVHGQTPFGRQTEGILTEHGTTSVGSIACPSRSRSVGTTHDKVSVGLVLARTPRPRLRSVTPAQHPSMPMSDACWTNGWTPFPALQY